MNRFADKLAKLWKLDKIGIAVSGGVDSMALSYLVRQHYKGKIVAFTIDHKARSNSTQEAQIVGQNLQNIGISDHEILTVESHLPTKRFELLARDERRRLLVEACRRHGISHLFMGHTLNDQLETFLLRLVMGSSTNGLACTEFETLAEQLRGPPNSLSNIQEDPNVWLVRPLIDSYKDDLKQLCTSHNVAWVEDPTNFDPTLTMRNSIRKLLETPSQLPQALQPQRIALTIAALQQSRLAIEKEADAMVKYMDRQGLVSIDEKVGTVTISECPEYVSSKRSVKALVLIRLCRRIAPQHLNYNLSQMDGLVESISADRPKSSSAIKKRVNHYRCGLRFCLYPQKDSDLWTYHVFRQRIRKVEILAYKVLTTPEDNQWSEWTLVDKRFWVRIRNKGSKTNVKVNCRLVYDDTEVRTAVAAKLRLAKIQASPKLFASQPFFMIHNPADPFALMTQDIVGFPTLGLYDNSIVEIETQLKSYNASSKF